MKTNDKMHTANKLLMLQGITLIHNGIEFLEWMTDHKDMNTMDALTILKDRFQYFRECALEDGRHDTMLIKRTKYIAGDIKSEFYIKKDIENKLEEIRDKIVRNSYAKTS